ncbi:MAG: NAD(P)-dependent oxidoreductase [Verrucomicrobia bacterium]|nr:NAD(P)-dependent oxidoreductase [Verrucomicrobiota bacterium]
MHADRILITGGSGFIGTALVSLLQHAGAEVRNIDLAPPQIDEHHSVWIKGSVLDEGAVRAVADAFRPTHLVHLAAETSIETTGKRLSEMYPVNVCATDVLANALVGHPLQLSIFVSTQYVCGPQGGLPRDDTHFFPHTEYGESKVAMEKTVRQRWTSPYVIVRPTYVWGPHHTKYFRDVCHTLARGTYCHPGGTPVIRAYAYVDTVAQMIIDALARPDLTGRVLYATDRPEDSYAFVNRLSLALRGRPARRAPRLLLKGLALIGDRWRRCPMNSFRYRSMTTDYPVPYTYTFDQLGEPKPDLTAGAVATAHWFHNLP